MLKHSCKHYYGGCVNNSHPIHEMDVIVTTFLIYVHSFIAYILDLILFVFWCSAHSLGSMAQPSELTFSLVIDLRSFIGGKTLIYPSVDYYKFVCMLVVNE